MEKNAKDSTLIAVTNQDSSQEENEGTIDRSYRSTINLEEQK